MEMAEKLSGSIRRSTTLSAATAAASASVTWVTATLIVVLTFGCFVWWLHEWILFLISAVFLRRFHRENVLWVLVLVIPVVFLCLSHDPSLLDSSPVVCV